MTAPTHILTGLASLVIVSRVGGPTPDSVGFLAFVIGTLAPDIDGQGTITRPGKFVRRQLGRGVADLLDGVGSLVSGAIRSVFGHRGFLHAPIVAIGLVFAGMELNYSWLAWFGGGYAAHLFGDAMTVSGIPIWSPLSSKRWSLSPMRTGSKTEVALAGLLLLFLGAYGSPLLPIPLQQTHRQLIELLVSL